MLSRYTYILQTENETGESGAGVSILDEPIAQQFHATIETWSGVYGEGSGPWGAVVRRVFGDDVRNYWHVPDARAALWIAEHGDGRFPLAVRACAAALVLNRAWGTGTDAAIAAHITPETPQASKTPPEPRDNGGRGNARLRPTRPRRPPSGGAINPLAALTATA